MSFLLVPNSVTLDDLERRNSPNRRVISPNSVAFGADYVKVVEDTPILSAAEMWANESSFSDISFMAILARDHPSESVKVKHSPVNFRLVPKSVTLNDLERRNGRYIALFH